MVGVRRDRVRTETTGLDGERLERIGDHLVERYVRPGEIAGCQVLVARRGRTAYFRCFGLADLERRQPVREDTIWRIYSMTKPITSVALMTLYERGCFQLTDPVHRFLPEWKEVRVCVTEGGRSQLVEPERPVTVRDLLTHTAGLSYGMEPEHPVDRLYAEAGLRDPSMTLEELSRRLASLPLAFQPGSRWRYSFATDVCGRLVEVLADRPFGQYLRETIFEPLGMVDTGFVVPAGAGSRFAANYQRRPEGGLQLLDDPARSPYLTARPLESGGGGLVSTAPDYLRFCEMLRRGGELEGARVLGPRTVAFMACNHLPGGAPLSRIALGAFGETRFPGVGFGLGLAVLLDPVEAGGVGSPGEVFWGGAASTLFWVDPAEDLVVIFMAQLMPSGTFDFRGQLRQLVHQAIVG
jgi:CubicO group peptidase (beta-lactamase class C family)